MGHDGDARPDNTPRDVCNLMASFELDGLGAALLYKSAGIAQGVLQGYLVGHEGHIAHEQGPFGCPGHGTGMVDHIGHGDGKGAVVTQNGHTQGIAHKDHVDSGRVHRQGSGIIVGCKHGYFFAFFLHGPYGCRCDAGDDRLSAHGILLSRIM
jgi:hypothetical protein